MKIPELAPAALITLLVTATLAGAQLLPFGQAVLLVRTATDRPAAAVAAASAADASLVTIPAPGFAVLYGDASRVRRALGLAVAWQGKAPCASRP